MGLQSCCCCVPLRQGTLTIAWLYLVGNVLGLLSWIIYMTVDHVSLRHADRPRPTYQLTIHVYILLGVMVASGLGVGTNTCLILAVRRSRRKLMLPWVVWYAIFTALVTITWLVGFGFTVDAMVRYHGTDNFGAAIGMFLAVVLPCSGFFLVMWYWYACVVSYYCLLAPSDSYTLQPMAK